MFSRGGQTALRFGSPMTFSAHSIKTIPCLSGGLPTLPSRTYMAWPDRFILPALQRPLVMPWKLKFQFLLRPSFPPQPLRAPSPKAQQLHFIFCGYAQACYKNLIHGQGRDCMAHKPKMMASSCSRVSVAFREGSVQDLGGTRPCAINCDSYLM